jgi:hypothetical protein
MEDKAYEESKSIPDHVKEWIFPRSNFSHLSLCKFPCANLKTLLRTSHVNSPTCKKKEEISEVNTK